MVNANAGEKFLKEGLTFDDVLLIPAKSDVLPKDKMCIRDRSGRATRFRRPHRLLLRLSRSHPLRRPPKKNPRRSRTRRPDIRRPLWSRSGSWTRAAGKSRPRRKRKRRHASLVRRPRRTTGSNESGHKKPPGREAGWLFHRSYLSP